MAVYSSESYAICQNNSVVFRTRRKDSTGCFEGCGRLMGEHVYETKPGRVTLVAAKNYLKEKCRFSALPCQEIARKKKYLPETEVQMKCRFFAKPL